jgi:hypothetical protein
MRMDKQELPEEALMALLCLSVSCVDIACSILNYGNVVLSSHYVVVPSISVYLHRVILPLFIRSHHYLLLGVGDIHTTLPSTIKASRAIPSIDHTMLARHRRRQRQD